MVSQGQPLQHGDAVASQVDAKIVEVALFFQRELESVRAPEAAPAGAAAGGSAMTVLLLSADNAQVRPHRTVPPEFPTGRASQ
jgi:hypothetical protein